MEAGGLCGLLEEELLENVVRESLPKPLPQACDPVGSVYPRAI